MAPILGCAKDLGEEDRGIEVIHRIHVYIRSQWIVYRTESVGRKLPDPWEWKDRTNPFLVNSLASIYTVYEMKIRD